MLVEMDGAESIQRWRQILSRVLAVYSLIDRHFDRSRYDAQRVIGRFTASLQEQVDPDEVVDGWMEVMEDTMQPEVVGVWVRRE